jgi:CMP-N-acetylneuraminic acid synthetase
MKVSIVIPAKGSSTRVKNKNLYEIGGKTLIRRACEKIIACDSINAKYLDTEDEGIKMDCSDLRKKGLQILNRPKEMATNNVGANELMAFALHSIDHCDLLLETFATTPLITAKTIDHCVNYFLDHREDHDSFFTVSKVQEYFWTKDKPLNFDPKVLPNSFELEPYLMETHGLYGILPESFLELKTRIGRKPMLIEIPKIEAFDIDTMEDLEIVETLINAKEGNR